MKADYARQYQQLWQRHWWWQARHRLVKRVAQEVLSEQDREGGEAQLLDIGCGGGLAFDEWSQLGDIRGIEPESHLATCLPQWESRVEAVEFGADYESDHRYDLIFMLDVLEHIEDDLGAAERIRSLLRDRTGAVILTVPALPSLWSVHDEVNLHYRRYTAATLRGTIEKAGLQVERLEYFFGWSLGLVMLRKWLTRKKPQQEYAVRVPPTPINAAFRWISLAEQTICHSLKMSPFRGSSLLAVARPAGS